MKAPQFFVQYKGTDICGDLLCDCGAHNHFDGEFAYVLRCPNCNALWELPTLLEPTLLPRTDRTPLEANPE